MSADLKHVTPCPACSPASDPESWLKDKIQHYTNEAARLEAQLKHVQVLLRGHRTWLQDVQRRKGAQR